MSENRTDFMRRRIVGEWVYRHTTGLQSEDAEYLTDLMLSDMFPSPALTVRTLPLPEPLIEWAIPTPKPLTVQISPDPSVERISESSAETETPDASPAGETQEEVSPPLPSPVTPVIQQPQTAMQQPPAATVASETVEKPAESLNAPGSSGAIYEARMYALSQIEKGEGIHTRIIANLTGWDAATVRKFACEIQDEWKRRKECKKSASVEEAIEDGFDALMAAISEEAEEEVIEPEPEPVADKPARELPPWWSLDIAKYCPVCHMLIQPAYYEGCHKWEQKDAYKARKTCGMACSKKLRKAA